MHRDSRFAYALSERSERRSGMQLQKAERIRVHSISPYAPEGEPSCLASGPVGVGALDHRLVQHRHTDAVDDVVLLEVAGEQEVSRSSEQRVHGAAIVHLLADKLVRSAPTAAPLVCRSA